MIFTSGHYIPVTKITYQRTNKIHKQIDIVSCHSYREVDGMAILSKDPDDLRTINHENQQTYKKTISQLVCQKAFLYIQSKPNLFTY